VLGENMKTRNIGLALAAVLILSMLTPAFPGPDKSAETLINNAQKLQSHAYYRNSVLINATTSLNASQYTYNISLILNLTKLADSYLNLSRNLYSEGNYTGAASYAIKAINTYGEVIELQEELSEALNVSFKAGKEAEEYNFTATNITAINRTALVLQLEVLKARIAELKNVLGRVNQSIYNVTGALNLLGDAEELLVDAEERLQAGNMTVPELAKILATVKKILGLVNAELQRASLKVTVVRAMKLGILKKNATEVLNMTPLINHTKMRGKGKPPFNQTEELEEVNKTLARVSREAQVQKEIKQLFKQAEKEIHEAKKDINHVRKEIREEERGPGRGNQGKKKK
jgi:hypothetical protein